MKTQIDELVVFCCDCEHSEFVHTDRGNRPCLFSDCDCSGLVVTTAETTPDTGTASLSGGPGG